MSDQGREAHLGSVLRYALAAASLGAGLIHFSAVFDHTGHAVVAAFFAVLSVVQVAWAVAVARRPSAGVLRAGAAISVGVVVIWLLSRTTGLGGVPGAEEPEALGVKDGMASLLEVLIVAGIAARFMPRAQGLRLASGRAASVLAVSAVGVLTATGLSAAGPGHHHGGGTHDHLAAAGDHGHDSAAGDHGHDSAASDHGHDPAAGDGGHASAGGGQGLTPGAASAAGHDAEDRHEAGDHHGAAGRDHHSAGARRAAGSAAHDHDAPGHVHDPSHHHEPGHVHDPSHHHEPGHVHDPSHHHEPGHVHDPSHHHEPGHVHDPAHHHDQSGHSDPSGGHDHESAGDTEPAHDHEDGGGHHQEGGHDHGGSGPDHGSGDHHHEGGGDHHHGGSDPGDAEGCTSPLPANEAVATVQETAQSTIGAGCRLQTASPTGDAHRHSPLRRSAHHFIS